MSYKEKYTDLDFNAEEHEEYYEFRAGAEAILERYYSERCSEEEARRVAAHMSAMEHKIKCLLGNLDLSTKLEEVSDYVGAPYETPDFSEGYNLINLTQHLIHAFEMLFFIVRHDQKIMKDMASEEPHAFAITHIFRNEGINPHLKTGQYAKNILPVAIEEHKGYKREHIKWQQYLETQPNLLDIKTTIKAPEIEHFFVKKRDYL